MRIEHDPLASPDLVSREREEYAAGPGASSQHGDDESISRGDDVAGKIVHGVDVAPQLIGRAVGRLDQPEMDAVRPVVGAAHEQQHPRRAPEHLRISGP